MPVCHLVPTFLPLQYEQTALHLASGSGHDKVCQVLLHVGANVHVTNAVSIKISTYFIQHYCIFPCGNIF